MATQHVSKLSNTSQPKKRHLWPWVVGGVVLIFFGFVVMIGIGVALMSQSFDSSPDYSSSGSFSGAQDNLVYGDLGAESAPVTTAAGKFLETSQENAASVQIEQKVVKTAELSIVADSTNASVASISQVAESMGGFVISSSTYTDTDNTTAGSISIRVPADSFGAALTDIKSAASVVESESVSGTDVTEEYIDLQARLTNQQALESNLVGILSKAGSVEDTLKVTRALGDVREQIELLQGQIQYIQARTDFSTISVSIAERPSVIPSLTKSFDVLLIFQRAVQALVLFAEGLLTILIWVVVFVGPVFLIIWVVWKLARHNKANGKSRPK